MQYTVRKEILCSLRITIEVGSKKQVVTRNSLNIHEILRKIILMKNGHVIYRWKGNIELVKNHNRFVIQISTPCPEFIKYSWEIKIWKKIIFIKYGLVINRNAIKVLPYYRNLTNREINAVCPLTTLALILWYTNFKRK